MKNQRRPDTKTIYPPYISAARPKRRRKAPVTREKTLAGQVRDSGGISRADAKVGRSVLNPLIKYSCKQLAHCKII